MKIATKLDSVKIKNINKITRIPGIETIISKGNPKLFGIRYFIFNSKFKKIPLVIRITSLKKNFDVIYGVDVFSKNGKNAIELLLKPEVIESKEKFIEFISQLSMNTKVVKESYNVLNNYLSYLNEIDPKIVGALVSTVIGTMTSGILVYSILSYKIKEWKLKKEADEASGPAEQAINDKLFGGTKYNDPAFKMYANLQNFIKYVVLGKAPAVIICGPPGMSKTHIVKRTFYFENLKAGKDYVVEKGSTLNVAAIYDLLYKNKNRILVLDDFDSPLKNEDTVNMLKAITDSYSKRIISIPREKTHAASPQSDISPDTPSKFEYKGRLIIITNLKKKDIDRALLSRAPAFEVNYNPKEILNYLDKFIHTIRPEVDEKTKREVLDYIIYLYAKDKNIEVNFRSFQNSIDAKVGNPLYWKEMVHTIVNYKA